MLEKTTKENKAISILKLQIDALNIISNVDEWNNWQNRTIVFVVSIYGPGTTQHFQFYNLSANHGVIGPGIKPNVPKVINQARNLLESFVKDIEIFGFSTPKNKDENNKAPNIKIENNIDNTNNNSQTQNISINIIQETIQDELPPAKLREIQEIAKSEESKESKLQKVGEILKATGIEVVSSTLAKVIGQSMGIY